MIATVAQTLYRPAHSALLPSLCRSPDELTSANVVRGVLDSLATLAGPLLSAVLIAVSGPAAVLGACAIVSAAGALLVTRLRYEEPPRERYGRVSLLETVAGLRAIAADPGLRLLTGLTTLQTFLRGSVSVLLVVVALELLHRSDADVGLLNAAIGVGALIGSLLAATVSWNGRLGRCFGVGVALWGAPLAVLGGVPHMGTALVLLGVVGLGNALVDVGVFTLIARMAPDEVMARAFAGFEAMLTFGVALGAAATPPMIHVLGVRGALTALGLVSPAAVIAAWRRLHALDRRMAARDGDIAVLQRVPILRSLPEVMIESLASGIESSSYAPGSTVVLQGDAGDRFYVIADGIAQVSRSGRPLAELGRGDCFGEIALLRPDLPRTATVRATGDRPLQVYILSQARFLTAMTGYPSSGALADSLVRRRMDEH